MDRADEGGPPRALAGGGALGPRDRRRPSQSLGDRRSALGVRFQVLKVRRPDEFAAAFAET